MSKDKIIISAALTGAATNRSHCPHIPYTPIEIAEEAKRAVDSGASIVHIHAREDNGVPSWKTEVFEEISKEVRARCPEVIINYSTGAIGLSVEERVKHLPATQPEMAAFNMGSMNYAIFSKKAKQFFWNGVFENSFDTMIKVVETMNKNGITPENLMHQIKQVPEGAFWQSIVISRKQWRLTALATMMGGNIRVGLEDNFYLPKGEMAKSNGELVAEAVNLARMMGREPATIAETREALNIPRISKLSV